MVDCINRPWMARTGTRSTSMRYYHSLLHPPPQRPRTTTVSSRAESSFILPLDSHREYFTNFQKKIVKKGNERLGDDRFILAASLSVFLCRGKCWDWYIDLEWDQDTGPMQHQIDFLRVYSIGGSRKD